MGLSEFFALSAQKKKRRRHGVIGILSRYETRFARAPRLNVQRTHKLAQGRCIVESLRISVLVQTLAFLNLKTLPETRKREKEK